MSRQSFASVVAVAVLSILIWALVIYAIREIAAGRLF